VPTFINLQVNIKAPLLCTIHYNHVEIRLHIYSAETCNPGEILSIKANCEEASDSLNPTKLQKGIDNQPFRECVKVSHEVTDTKTMTCCLGGVSRTDSLLCGTESKNA